MRNIFSDSYHTFLTGKWRHLIPLLVVALILTNCIFTELYLLVPGAINNARPGSFRDAFFFSTQTLSTVGYGGMSPNGLYGSSLAAIEAFLGLFGFAISSALMFAKFSRPTARVLFSKHAVITERDGEPCLLFRLANERSSNILQATLGAVLIRNETTREGEVVRKLHDLELVRGSTPIFALTWTVIHRIRPDSPFWGCTPQTLDAHNMLVVLTFTGLEDTFAQTVHGRQQYRPGDIRWNHKFADILIHEGGKTRINYERFHDVIASPSEGSSELSELRD